jgi:hypothetical protein
MHHEDAQNGPTEVEPTTNPFTTEGRKLVAAFPPGELVRFTFAADPELPHGLEGEARVVGVREDVYDDGDGESGPHLSYYVALVIEHEGEQYDCHPEDSDATLALVNPTDR